MEKQETSPEMKKATLEEHNECVQMLQTTLMMLGTRFDPIDIVFAVGETLDTILTQIEEQAPEPGAKLRKTIAIAIEEKTHEDVLKRIDKEV